MRISTLAAALACLIVLGAAPDAHARQSTDLTYSYEQAWAASIRLIAVDFRFPITQRDEGIGFLLFEYQDGGRTYHGSLELVRTTGRHDTPAVRVTVQVQNMPSYVERHVLDRLQRKLGEDYGQPPPTRPRPAPPVADDDADDDAREDEAAPDEAE